MPDLPPALPPPWQDNFFPEEPPEELRDVRNLKEVNDTDEEDEGDHFGEDYNDESDNESDNELDDESLDYHDVPCGPYPSLPALRAALQAAAADDGFAVVIARSDLVRGIATIKCVCGGLPRSTRGPDFHKIRQQPLHTQLIGCPFLITAKRSSPTPNSDAVWTSTTVHDTHNHPPIAPIGLSVLRRASVTPEVRTFIIGQIDGRVPARDILKNVALEYPSAILTPGDIYRLTYRRRAAVRVGHTATEACINKLIDQGELHKPFLNEDRQLMGLVYTTHTARALLHRFPTVLFMDCTYKTNRYSMPMLHIVGFTSTNQTYTVAIAFILRKSTEWYTVALEAFLDLTGAAKLPIKVVITDREAALINALAVVLPDTYQLSCIWHLGENVKTHVKPCFLPTDTDDDDYDWIHALKAFRLNWIAQVVSAKTEEDIQKGMDGLRSQYPGPRYERALDYVEGLLEIQERFVHAFIDKYTHLGQRGNSRLEGNHRALKIALRTHHGDMYLVIDALRDFFKLQWDSIKQRITLERTRTCISTTHFFDRVRPVPPTPLVSPC